jgi:hypothetical protein
LRISVATRESTPYDEIGRLMSISFREIINCFANFAISATWMISAPWVRLATPVS